MKEEEILVASVAQFQRRQKKSFGVFKETQKQGFYFRHLHSTLSLVTHRLGCAPWWGALFHLLPWPRTASTLVSPQVQETWRVSCVFLPPGAGCRMKTQKQETEVKAPQGQAEIIQVQPKSGVYASFAWSMSTRTELLKKRITMRLGLLKVCDSMRRDIAQVTRTVSCAQREREPDHLS